MRRYHVAGLSGTGKTAVGKRLAELGYAAIDTDRAPGLCGWVHTASMTPLARAPEHPWPQDWLESHQWVWSASRLRELLDQAGDIVFVCGGAHNEEDFADWFDVCFYLHTDNGTLKARLQRREPKRWSDGSAELSRSLEWNHDLPPPHARLILIDSTGPIEQVTEEILRHVRAST